jgi:hypothetical protein
VLARENAVKNSIGSNNGDGAILLVGDLSTVSDVVNTSLVDQTTGSPDVVNQGLLVVLLGGESNAQESEEQEAKEQLRRLHF